MTATLDQDAVREVLEANGVETSNAKLQTLQGNDGERIRVQVATSPTRCAQRCRRRSRRRPASNRKT